MGRAAWREPRPRPAINQKEISRNRNPNAANQFRGAQKERDKNTSGSSRGRRRSSSSSRGSSSRGSSSSSRINLITTHFKILMGPGSSLLMSPSPPLKTLQAVNGYLNLLSGSAFGGGATVMNSISLST
eukprot:GHVT01070038.1.p1 GENE.GHVT01070038.1~~GHVT01070038.1.p1  ORF type:complete len:129 (+),score=20.37 GHVT01070038.1:549-935(+)